MKRVRGTNQYAYKTSGDWKKITWAYFIFVFLLCGTATYFKHIGYAQAYTAKKERVVMLTPTPTPFVANFKDAREKKVFEYLEEKGSPLSRYASYIVNMADKYAIDYTLTTAISGKESSFGKAIPEGSHNAWGVMAWDSAGNRHVRQFASWEESIEFESKLLSENYKENMNQGIQAKYCPSFECSNTWVTNVTAFQKEIMK